MDGKEKCEFLRTFRKKIAEDNGIVLEQKDCTHEGDCLGTCPMCDAEAAFLMDELKKKEVIHIKADGKMSMENADINIDNLHPGVFSEVPSGVSVQKEVSFEQAGEIFKITFKYRFSPKKTFDGTPNEYSEKEYLSDEVTSQDL